MPNPSRACIQTIVTTRVLLRCLAPEEQRLVLQELLDDRSCCHCCTPCPVEKIGTPNCADFRLRPSGWRDPLDFTEQTTDELQTTVGS